MHLLIKNKHQYFTIIVLALVCIGILFRPSPALATTNSNETNVVVTNQWSDVDFGVGDDWPRENAVYISSAALLTMIFFWAVFLVWLMSQAVQDQVPIRRRVVLGAIGLIGIIINFTCLFVIHPAHVLLAQQVFVGLIATAYAAIGQLDFRMTITKIAGYCYTGLLIVTFVWETALIGPMSLRRMLRPVHVYSLFIFLCLIEVCIFLSPLIQQLVDPITK